jgi:Kef-type K+ transport system membrane component KefB
MENIFFEVGIILIIATLLALLFRFFKQPPMLAYIITGVIIGPLFLDVVSTEGVLQTFAQLGVAFLLFIVGLNLNLNLLREVGKASVFVGIIQIAVTVVLGFILSHYYRGFSPLEAAYLAVALTFSSTIIVVKLLSDKSELDTLYGKISLGILLVQDAVAILVLVLLSGFAADHLASNLTKAVLHMVILGLVSYLAAKLFLSKFFERVARSPETLFLSALSWCFALSLFAHYLGFTIEIGAFLAGITLASLPYSTEITSKVKPLRDFFTILFFVMIGSSLVGTNLKEQLSIILLLSLFVLIIKPASIFFTMVLKGFKARTSFLVGATTAQVSEFSLIIAAVGIQSAQLSDQFISILSAVTIITVALSTYLVTNDEKVFNFLSPLLRKCEKKDLYEKKLSHHHAIKKYDIILLGQHRIGHSILKNLAKKKARVLVVDYNPTIIQKLMEQKIPCIYGDVADTDILREIKHHHPKMVISTIHLFEDNLLVTKVFRKLDKKMTIIVTANTVKKALELYVEGADYVIIPHILGGEKVSDMLHSISNKKKLNIIRQKHIRDLAAIDV